MEINYDELVREWSERLDDRAPIYTNRYHRTVLRDVMKDFGYSLELVDGVRVEPTKKNFKNEVTKQVINLGRLLQEASVFQDKYSTGSRFMLGADGLDKMKKHSGESSIPDGVWLKVNEPKDTKNVIDAIHDENGRAEFWVKSEKNSKVYHVKGKSSVIDKWFKKATKRAGDINFTTDTLETCALLGLTIDGKAELAKLNALTGPDDPNMTKVVTAFINKVDSALSSGDWKNHDLKNMKTAGFPQIVLIAAISAGMSKFVSDKGLTGWNFIHGKIGDYYKAETENPHIETSGGKDNTADCILVDSPIGTFLSDMKIKPASFDKSSGICTLDSGQNFYQVSLKKVEGGAQLGKITKDFINKFGLISNEDILRMVITESLQDRILDEGLKDLFNKGKEFIKSGGKKLLDGIKKISQKIVKFAKGLTSTFKSAVKRANKDGDNLIKKIANDNKLFEAKKKFGVAEACQKIADEYNSGNKKALDDLLGRDNELLTLVYSKSKGQVGVDYLTDVKKLSIKGKVDFDVVVKFLSNYKALSAFKTVLVNEKGNLKDASDIYDEFIELEKQMFFGKTGLPLFKVYGLDAKGSGTAYKFLKTGKEFEEERQSEFDKKGDTISDVFLVYVEAKSGYGTMGAYVFSHFSDNVPKFNYVTFRTNKSGAVTFVIEGSKTKTWDWVKSNYNL